MGASAYSRAGGWSASTATPLHARLSARRGAEHITVMPAVSCRADYLSQDERDRAGGHGQKVEDSMSVSRRDFARLLAVTGSAAFLPELGGRFVSSPLPRTPAEPDEKFWKEVRARFLLPSDLAFLNAANLCPTSTAVVEALERNTRFLDADPSSARRARLTEGREESRRLLAKFLGVTAEEIVITRNTSEANNLVSS